MPCGRRANGLGALEAGIARRPDDHLEAQDRGFSRAHAFPTSSRPDPVVADTLFRTAAALLSGEADGVTRSRLIGVGTAALVEDLAANPPTLFNREFDRLRRLEYSMNSNSRQARRSIRTTRPRPAGHQQDPYDISAQGMKMTG